MRKSSGRTPNYPEISSRYAEKLTTFRQQMADFARGQRLIELRDARHLSQEDAAHEIGTTTKSLRAWEHGGKIRWENAKRVAAFYGVDAESLVSRESASENGNIPTVDTVPDELREHLDRIERILTVLVNRTPGAAEQLEAELQAAARTARRPADGNAGAARARAQAAPKS